MYGQNRIVVVFFQAEKKSPMIYIFDKITTKNIGKQCNDEHGIG